MAAKREPMAGEQYNVKLVLSDPCRKRRIRTAGEDREGRASGRGCEHVPRAAKLALGL